MPDQHSPEPWYAGDYQGSDSEDSTIFDAKGNPLIVSTGIEGSGMRFPNDADRERAIACVNFLRGVPTEVLETINEVALDGLIDRLDELKGLLALDSVLFAPCPTTTTNPATP